jgi:hypothetical protein
LARVKDKAGAGASSRGHNFAAQCIIGTPLARQVRAAGLAAQRGETMGASASICQRFAPLAAVWLALSLNLASAAGWQPNEAQISAEKELIDAEFNQRRQQLTWVDNSGRVWVANLDPDTGLLRVADGREVLVDPDAMRLGEAPFAFNGPEWTSSSTTDQITYTKFVPGAPRIQANARVAIARPAPDGTWTFASLSPNRSRSISYGSQDAPGASPLISYIDSRGGHYWRETGKTNTEHRIQVGTDKFVPLRFVVGARAMLLTVQVNGVRQVHQLDLDTQVLTQLTFDDLEKNSPFMWQAPEFGNEFVMFTLAENNLRFYRLLPDNGGNLRWTLINELVPPAGYQARTPEPFVYGGRSYVYLAMNAPPNDFNSEIWVAGADPAQPIFKGITPTTPLVGRGDPEIFVTTQGPRIYFNRYSLVNGGGCHTVTCSEGLWFADPGLPGPP